MKGRESSSRRSGRFMYPAALLLFFVAAFGLLFYELYQGSIAFEKEKNHHDLDLLSSSLQSILLSDEGFFMARLRETSVISALQRECQEYISVVLLNLMKVAGE